MTAPIIWTIIFFWLVIGVIVMTRIEPRALRLAIGVLFAIMLWPVTSVLGLYRARRRSTSPQPSDIE